MSSKAGLGARGRRTRFRAVTALSALAGAVVGVVVATLAAPALQDRMMPWILGRGLGLAAYLDIVALALVGTWFRHPWRWRRPVLHPAVLLRLHVALAVAAVILVAGHVVVFALDRYAGVGWVGTLIPGRATYRPLAVGLGTLGLYVGAAVGISAGAAGRFAGSHWLAIHRLALGGVALAWLHSVLAGSDTAALRPMYAITGAALLAMVGTRLAAQRNDTNGPEPNHGGGDPDTAPQWPRA